MGSTKTKVRVDKSVKRLRVPSSGARPIFGTVELGRGRRGFVDMGKGGIDGPFLDGASTRIGDVRGNRENAVGEGTGRGREGQFLRAREVFQVGGSAS